MKSLTMREVDDVSGACVVANDVQAVAIGAGLLLAPEVTVPMMVVAGISLIGLQLDNLGY